MKTLFFLDIDGTLILENQRPNTNELQQFIKKFRNSNKVLFGLNSNRPIQDLIPIYKQFNLNGPIIVENGIYFKKSLHDKPIFLVNNPPQALPKIVKKIIRSYCVSSQKPILFKVTDTVKFFKRSKKIKSRMILMDKFRRYTASLHALNNGKRDRQLAKKIKKYLDRFVIFKKNKIEIKVSEVFSNILLQTTLINKGRALKKIRQFYQNYQFIMIGDDENDLSVVNNVDKIAAVSNATKKFKSQANFIAKKSYTKGVLEIIKYYLKN